MNSEQAPPRAAVRVALPGQAPGTPLPVGEGLTVGRSSKNGLVLTEVGVSRRHVEIRHLGEGRYGVFDRGSRNGTMLNGKRIDGLEVLRDGDVLFVGKARLRFEADARATSTMSSLTDASGTAMGLQEGMAVVLMSDIRNYTKLTAELPAEAFQAFVSEWFHGVIDIVEMYRGTVDRIVGDGILAYWFREGEEAPVADVRAALHAANDTVDLMHRQARSFDLRFPDASDHFRVGIALNAGPATLGNLGDGKHHAFTVLGDCVNLAARIEALCKKKNRTLLVGQSIRDWAPPHLGFEELEAEMVRGRSHPLAVFAPANGLGEETSITEAEG